MRQVTTPGDNALESGSAAPRDGRLAAIRIRIARSHDRRAAAPVPGLLSAGATAARSSFRLPTGWSSTASGTPGLDDLTAVGESATLGHHQSRRGVARHARDAGGGDDRADRPRLSARHPPRQPRRRAGSGCRSPIASRIVICTSAVPQWSRQFRVGDRARVCVEACAVTGVTTTAAAGPRQRGCVACSRGATPAWAMHVICTRVRPPAHIGHRSFSASSRSSCYSPFERKSLPSTGRDRSRGRGHSPPSFLPPSRQIASSPSSMPCCRSSGTPLRTIEAMARDRQPSSDASPRSWRGSAEHHTEPSGPRSASRARPRLHLQCAFAGAWYVASRRPEARPASRRECSPTRHVSRGVMSARRRNGADRSPSPRSAFLRDVVLSRQAGHRVRFRRRAAMPPASISPMRCTAFHARPRSHSCPAPWSRRPEAVTRRSGSSTRLSSLLRRMSVPCSAARSA